MRLRFVSVIVLMFALGCAQTGNPRDEPAAGPQPAKKYKPDTPVTPKAMQPVPSSY
jgi:hypothetical protein